MVIAATAILSLAASLLTNWGMETLQPRFLLGGFAGLKLSHNPGIAFSIDLGSPLQEILIGAALVLVCVAALQARDTLSRIAFGMIIGGALANILDRLSDGYVTDYVAVGTFPIFNLADSCISLGVGLLILEALRMKKKGGNGG